MFSSFLPLFPPFSPVIQKQLHILKRAISIHGNHTWNLFRVFRNFWQIEFSNNFLKHDVVKNQSNMEIYREKQFHLI